MFEKPELTNKDNAVVGLIKTFTDNPFNAVGISEIAVLGVLSRCLEAVNKGVVVIAYNPKIAEVFVKPHPILSNDLIPQDDFYALQNAYLQFARKSVVGDPIDHISLVLEIDKMVGNPVYVEDWVIPELLKQRILQVTLVEKKVNDQIVIVPAYMVVGNLAETN